MQDTTSKPAKQDRQMTDRYPATLTEEHFAEIKAAAISIWSEYDDSHGYATGKINRIKDLPNSRQNARTIVQMFDGNNKVKLLHRVSTETGLIVLILSE